MSLTTGSGAAGGSAHPGPQPASARASDRPRAGNNCSRRCAKPSARAEAEAVARGVLDALLRRRGLVVHTATTANQALTIAAREKITLLLSDIGLPDSDGYAVMRELRRRTELRGVALTGYGADEDLSRSRAAGFAAHLGAGAGSGARRARRRRTLDWLDLASPQSWLRGLGRQDQPQITTWIRQPNEG